MVKYPDGLEVPCGKCLNCRITKRGEWSMRLLHELEFHTHSCFVTLTYSDDYLPPHSSLRLSDLQKFFKRLRKSLLNHKIRYFAAGEYGDLSQRPHYHAIIFGLGLWPEHQLLIKRSWNAGLVHCGTATAESIQYVCAYIDKKFSGDLAEEEYVNKERESVFKVSSLGIGRQYVDTYRDKIIANRKLTVRGKPHSIPRYYLNRLDIDTDLIRTESIRLDKERSERIIGVSIERDVAYHVLEPAMVVDLEQGIQRERYNRQANTNARLALKKRSKI